jgi:enoyl-CoA hydratase
LPFSTDASPPRELVTATTIDGVGVIRLTDPEHRNALSADLSNQLAQSVHQVLESEAGAIVLFADPPVFCAGGSFDSLLSRDVPLEEMYRGLVALAGSPVPTIAAVGGPTIGAGVNLPLACDVVVTTPQARFDPRFLDVGIHPGGGHLWRMQHRVGHQGAAAVVLFGETLDGSGAVQAGLAWRCVRPEDLESTALALAGRAAGRPRALVERTKESMRASGAILDWAEACALELEAQRWSMAQPGFDDRIRSLQRDLAERTGTLKAGGSAERSTQSSRQGETA